PRPRPRRPEERAAHTRPAPGGSRPASPAPRAPRRHRVTPLPASPSAPSPGTLRPCRYKGSRDTAPPLAPPYFFPPPPGRRSRPSIVSSRAVSRAQAPPTGRNRAGRRPTERESIFSKEHCMAAAFVYDDRLLEYDFGPAHPLRPQRLRLTHELLRAYGAFEQ